MIFFNFVTKTRLAFQNDFMNIHIFAALPDANWITLKLSPYEMARGKSKGCHLFATYHIAL